MPTSFTNQALTNPTISTSNNRLSSTGWDYDSSGNTTDDPNGREFVYDAENKQVKVTDGAEVIGEYWYDGDGKRVRKHVPSTGEVTVFVYDASGKLIAEYSTIVETTNAKVGYATNDHLGSPRINTDANGAVTSRHDYHPFGEEIASSQRTTGLGYADDTVRKQFTGYERDGETELDFAQARMFGSNLGRFTSPDPYKIVVEIKFERDPEKADARLKRYLSQPQRWNAYVYALNNPLKYTNPSGETIRLRGTQKDLTEAVNLLYEILGPERRAAIVCNAPVEAENGEFTLDLSLSKEDAEKIANIGDDSDNKTLSKGMAEMLSSSKIVEARIDGNFINLQGNVVDVRPVSNRVGATVIQASRSSTGHDQVVISPFSVNQANEAAKQPGNLEERKIKDMPLTFTKAQIFAHEFGEAWGVKGGAVAFENAMRSRDKSNPQRRVRRGDH
jgi:RHS repeat-associated protein